MENINQITKTLYLRLKTLTWLKTLYSSTVWLKILYFTAVIATLDKIITYALGEHDPGSAQDWKTPSDFWRPDSSVPQLSGSFCTFSHFSCSCSTRARAQKWHTSNNQRSVWRKIHWIDWEQRIQDQVAFFFALHCSFPSSMIIFLRKSNPRDSV